jgi:hypothetical protein
MHYGTDPERKRFSVVLCLNVKNCQEAIQQIVYQAVDISFLQLIRSSF